MAWMKNRKNSTGLSSVRMLVPIETPEALASDLGKLLLNINTPYSSTGTRKTPSLNSQRIG